MTISCKTSNIIASNFVLIKLIFIIAIPFSTGGISWRLVKADNVSPTRENHAKSVTEL
jgi:hypothetical protein